MKSLRRLFSDCGGEAFGIGNADPQHGMVLEPDNLWNLVYERNAQTLVMIGAKGESVISETEPQPNRGIPTVWPRYESMVDVVKSGLQLESPVAGDEFAIL